jgi:hypothetical protein
MNANPLEPVIETPFCRLTQGPGVVVGRFWGETRLEEADALGRAIERGLEASPRIALLVIIEDDCQTPTREARERLAQVLGAVSGGLTCFGGVVVGKGLRATSKRTMMRVILTFARLRTTCEVFDDPEAAATWIAREIARADGIPYTPRALLAAVGRDKATE